MMADRMHTSSTFSRLCCQAAFLALACSVHPAHADDDDVISPDRPNIANSSQVVGQGRVQLEIGVNWDRQRDDALHLRTLTTPALLRIGLGETTELRLETDGRNIEHTRDRASGARTTDAGWNATSVGFKWRLTEGEGAYPALGLIGQVALPTGSTALRGRGLLPQLVLAAEWELPQDWSLAVTQGAGSDRDDHGARYGYGILAASLGKKFNQRTQGFLEVAAPQIASSSHGGKQVQVDLGVSWLVNKDCQVDAMVVRGLNRNTPDLSLAFGLSLRR